MNLLKEGTFIEEAEKAEFKPNNAALIFIFIGLFCGLQILEGIASYILQAVLGLQGQWDMVITLIFTGFVTVGIIVYGYYVEGRSLASFGFIRKHVFSQYIKGFILGILIFSIIVGIGVFTGSLAYEACLANQTWRWVLIFLFGWLFQGMEEEVMLRGYLMPNFSRRTSLLTAVIANSILFAALHLGNNGITVLSFINLIFYGIFASLYATRTNNIWGISGFHSAWNFVQGNIYGISVSGNAVLPSIFNITQKNSALLNGGTFGLEGSLITTIVLSICIALLFVPGIIQRMNASQQEQSNL